MDQCRSPRVSQTLGRRLPRSLLSFGALGALAVGLLAPAGDVRSSPPVATTAPGAGAVDPLPTLLRELQHQRAARRRQALIAIADLGDAARPALPKIWPLVRDPDPLVRVDAARAVWLVGEQIDLAVSVLRGVLSAESPTASGLAIFLLGEIGPNARGATAALETCLAADDEMRRLQAAEALIKIDPAHLAAHEAILTALTSSAPAIRGFGSCAAISAGPDFADKIDAALLCAMADDDRDVAAAAALALECRKHAVGNDAAVQQVAGSQSDLSVVALQVGLASESPVVRATSARALWARQHDAAALVSPLLDVIASSPSNASTLAVDVLGEIGPEAADALPELYELFEAASPLARLQVAVTLTRVDPRGREAIVELCQAVRSPESDERYLAALALGQVSAAHRKRAERELTAALRDRNLRVRAAARRALTALENVVETAPPEIVLRPEPAQKPKASSAPRQPAAKPIAAERPPVAPDPGLEERLAAIERRISADELRAVQLESTVSDVQRTVSEVESRSLSDPQPKPEVQTLQLDVNEDDADTIPTLVAQAEVPRRSTVPPGAPEPELVPPREPAHHPGWYDRDEETVEQHKPIARLRARIDAPEGDMPIDFATRHFAQYPTYVHSLGTTRGFATTSWSWEPTALCYNPLWFQDINLERYGWHYGCAQTIVSSVKFAADTALLPYKLIAECPCDCVYTLGYDRPGNCVPYRCYRLPWRTDAAVFLGGVATGLVFLAP